MLRAVLWCAGAKLGALEIAAEPYSHTCSCYYRGCCGVPTPAVLCVVLWCAGAKLGALEITADNRQLLRSAYTRRRPEELAVLTR